MSVGILCFEELGFFVSRPFFGSMLFFNLYLAQSLLMPGWRCRDLFSPARLFPFKYPITPTQNLTCQVLMDYVVIFAYALFCDRCVLGFEGSWFSWVARNKMGLAGDESLLLGDPLGLLCCEMDM